MFSSSLMTPRGQKSHLLFWLLFSVSMTLSAATNTSTNLSSNNESNDTSTNANLTSEKAKRLSAIQINQEMDRARGSLLPSLGASLYALSTEAIAAIPQGSGARFDQLLLRIPGVAQDGLGQVHVRGEHGELQYRINGVMIPEGITGFGAELDSRFASGLSLITGALPAQYGLRTAGVVDIVTQNGYNAKGLSFDFSGGSFDTLAPNLQLGLASDTLSLFISGSALRTSRGIENPTSEPQAVHAGSEQARGFLYSSALLSPTLRLSLLGGSSWGSYQLPNSPGLPAGTDGQGRQWIAGEFDSLNLNEYQLQQNHYAVLALQSGMGRATWQASVFGKFSGVHFVPDTYGDLYFNGVASEVNRDIWTGGSQADFSIGLGSAHTLRGGIQVNVASLNAAYTVHTFLVGTNGNAVSRTTFSDQSKNIQILWGAYVQDEWRLAETLTLNAGVRFDGVNTSSLNELQLSPRLNVVWDILKDLTVFHAGYAQYFTPPGLEVINASQVSATSGTANEPAVLENDPVLSERAHYMDVGIAQLFGKYFRLGVNGYAKLSEHQLDSGFFGQTLIPSTFNYAQGQILGAELTANFEWRGLSLNGSLTSSKAIGRQIESAQFLFDQDDLNYIKENWVSLDHDQTLTTTLGAAYRFKYEIGETLVFVDALGGTGLHKDDEATGIPNGSTVSPYMTLNLGVEQVFIFGGKKETHLRFRFDCINALDTTYLLRDGSGIGVNAAQFGQRRSFYGSVGLSF